MKKATTVCFALFIIMLFSLNLSALQKITIQIRLYEGGRDKTADGVMTFPESDTLDIKQVKIYTSISSIDEKESLMKIYGLAELKELKSMKVFLEANHSVSLPVSIGNTRAEFEIRHMEKKTDEFEIRLINTSDESEILQSRIILPQEKTVVLGLKDSKTGLIFLSLKREKDESDPRYPDARAIIYPSARVMVTPPYPPEAREKGIEDVVRIKASIDPEGNVTRVVVLEGSYSILNEAVIEALRQWKYEPMTINGHSREVEVEVKIVFKLK